MKHLVKILTGLCLSLCLLAGTAEGVLAAGLTISRNSMTIAIGETGTLTVTQDGSAVSGVTWKSDDSQVASVTAGGLVTGKSRGSANITATVGKRSVSCLVSVVKQAPQYTVLILDTSGSIKGTAFKREKEAAVNFVNKVLSSGGNHYIALVSLNGKSKKVLGFTRSKRKLKKAIKGLKAKGHTNMNQAFKRANALLKAKKSGAGVTKNIVLCSDGLPEKGSKSKSGRYKKSQHKYYKYANATYKTDVKSKKTGYFVYALGFFHNSSGKDLKFGKRLMKDLASKDSYYIVRKPKDINKAFKKIAKKVITNGGGTGGGGGTTGGGGTGRSTTGSDVAGTNAPPSVQWMVYVKFDSAMAPFGKTIDENGYLISMTKSAKNLKCGILVKETSYGYRFEPYIVGNNIEGGGFDAYSAKNGKVLYRDNISDFYHLLTVSGAESGGAFRHRDDGWWERGGAAPAMYGYMKDDETNEYVKIKSYGVRGSNIRTFTDETELKAWLLQ